MKIKFIPTNIEIDLDPNKSLLQLCQDNKIEIKSICKGLPSCAECRVKIAEGEYNVIPPSKAELALIGTSYYLDQRRLSCQVRAFGPITVDLNEQLERSDSQNKKVRGFRADPSHESRAIQGTLMLDERLAEEGDPHGAANKKQTSEPGGPSAKDEAGPNGGEAGSGGGRKRRRRPRR